MKHYIGQALFDANGNVWTVSSIAGGVIVLDSSSGWRSTLETGFVEAVFKPKTRDCVRIGGYAFHRHYASDSGSIAVYSSGQMQYGSASHFNRAMDRNAAFVWVAEACNVSLLADVVKMNINAICEFIYEGAA